MKSDTVELQQLLQERLGGYKQLLVAFSGGLDSSVLLHLLAQERYPGQQVRAVHIHHGLSRLADGWSEHCRQQCQRWQIPLAVIRVQVDVSQGGIEAAARQARYDALAAYLAPGETLVTAQHLDDQCETLLLALKRGSGPAGLSAMAVASDFATGTLLRPLLDLPRTRLEHYAREQGITWIEDDSNQDPRFDRNFLRLQVLPLLMERWPHFATTCARSAVLCAEQEQLLDELLAEPLAQLCDEQGSLAIAGLQAMTAQKRDAILRRWLAAQGALMPAREQLQRLWQEVALSREDGEPRLQWGGIQVRRYRQRLYLLPVFMPLRDQILPVVLQRPLQLPDGLGVVECHPQGISLRAPREGEQLSIRFQAAGHFRILGRQHGRQIKKLWQEFAIPPWERERIPLLYFGEQLMAALGVFVCQEAQVLPGEESICIRWVKPQQGAIKQYGQR